MSDTGTVARTPSEVAAVAPGAVRGRSWRDLPPWAGGVVGAVLVLVVWSVVGVFFSTGGIVPTPWAVVEQLHRNGFENYWTNISITTASAAQGWVWGNLIAIAIAVVVLLVPPLEGAANQVAVISYCIPHRDRAHRPHRVPAESRVTSVFLAAMSVVFTSVVGCLLGLRAADQAALDVVRAYGGTKWTALVKVRLIAALPNVFAALKLAAPASFLGAVLGEYFGGVDSGLGILIVSAQTNLQYAQIWGLALLSGAVAGAGYLLIGLLARLVTPWSSTG